MCNCLETFASSVCVCDLLHGQPQQRVQEGLERIKKGFKERQGSQLLERLEKWRNELNRKQQFGGK